MLILITHQWYGVLLLGCVLLLRKFLHGNRNNLVAFYTILHNQCQSVNRFHPSSTSHSLAFGFWLKKLTSQIQHHILLPQMLPITHGLKITLIFEGRRSVMAVSLWWSADVYSSWRIECFVWNLHNSSIKQVLENTFNNSSFKPYFNPWLLRLYWDNWKKHLVKIAGIFIFNICQWNMW